MQCKNPLMIHCVSTCAFMFCGNLLFLFHYFPQSKTEGKDNKKQKAKKESEEDEDSGEEDTDEEEEGDEDESDEEESDEDESDDDDDEDEEEESDEEDEIAASLVAKKKVGTLALQSHLNTNKIAIKSYFFFWPHSKLFLQFLS